MAYAYFKHDGALVSVSANQLEYLDDTIIEMEVPNLFSANSIYLDRDSMMVREREPFEIEVEYNMVRGLPSGTTVTIPDGQFVIEDGTAEFEADVASTVVAFIEHPRFIAQYVEVPTGPEGNA